MYAQLVFAISCFCQNYTFKGVLKILNGIEPIASHSNVHPHQSKAGKLANW